MRSPLQFSIFRLVRSRRSLLLQQQRVVTCLSTRFVPSIQTRRTFYSIDDMGKKQTVALKPPKGTKDWEGTDMVIREQIFSTITNVFKRHGAVSLDTPVFELREVLTEKYGEDSKLIYDLQDQGGEICSLRYDLTVPFARWMAMTGTQSIKRYHIAKVYRRDQPAMTKGRMREFYQCDIDFAGQADSMFPDAEIMKVICEVFNELGWQGKFTIKTNHRAILDGIFAVCGVPEEKIRTISSAVDKLDKSPWEEVKKEMVEEKGLSEEVADRIWSYVQKKGGKDVLEFLRNDEALKENERMTKGVEEMTTLFEYLDAFDILDKVEFNLSLARGLDYYTGLIYEVVTEGSAPKASSSDPKAKKGKSKSTDDDRSDDPTVGVGSVAAGGRYDGLVGRFSGKNIPCVGVSFGVERIFAVTKAKLLQSKLPRKTEIDVYVMALGFGKDFTGLVKERMKVCGILWDAGIKASFSYKLKPKLPAQFKAADEDHIPFAVILGEGEQAQGLVKIKEMGLPEGHPDKEGVAVKMEDLVKEVKSRLEAKAKANHLSEQADNLDITT